jgi:outer membrane protein OmpA-like peptidoglycan-associated protein
MKHIYLLLIGCSLTFAQAPHKDSVGCKDSAVLTRLPGCWIARCNVLSYNGADMEVSKAAPRTKHVEGEYEKIEYGCPGTVAGMQIWRESQAAFRKAGFTQVYEDNYFNARFQVTVHKGPQWAYLYAETGNYSLTTVKVKEIDQVMQANADGWAEQLSQSGRVSIYGINFDTGKATIRPDSEPVLQEVLALLKKQPDLCIVVAGHTDNVGTDAVNLPLSQQRAAAVIGWLSVKGIDKVRLTPSGFGSRKPLADNATEEGRAKNRRVDLVKLY